MDNIERLKLFRSSIGISQAKLATLLNIPQSTYANYESGKAVISDDVKIALSQLFKLNINWLLLGDGPMCLQNNENTYELKLKKRQPEKELLMDPYEVGRDVPGMDKDVYLLPITNLQLSAGNGSTWSTDEMFIDKYFPVPRRLASKFGDLVAAIVWGDSMEPTLFNGEPVAFSKNTQFDYDGIYVISWHNEIFIKRLSRIQNKIRIISDNTKYPIIEVDITDASEEFQILGKAVFWIHIEKKEIIRF